MAAQPTAASRPRSASTRMRSPNGIAILRAALYLRVSSEEQVQGYSLDAQERAGRAYCEAHGWPVAAVYRDEGKSARTDDLARRPDFARMLADAEAGLIDVIVVHKLDRFARNLRVTLDTLERLERAGVGFVSISEQMDFTTPIGKVILATLAAFAQYYSDNLATEVRKGKHERKAQGLYNGLLPFGIKKSRDGLPVPDPESYPDLLLAFRLAADGKSDRDVAEALNAGGHRTNGNRGRNPFTKDTVRRMLKNRFYLGELPDGRGGWVPGAHDAVLDPDLFDAVQRARAANRSGATGATSVARAARHYSLSGLAVCGGCGGRLHFHTAPNGRARAYCYQIRQRKGCGQPSVYLDGIEAQLADYLATFTLAEETVAEVVRLYEHAHDQRDDAARRRREIGNRLDRIRELYSWGDLTREAYLAERDRLEAELSTLKGEQDRAGMLAQAAVFLRDLPAAWVAATPEQRNAMARLVFQSVEIADDQVTAVTPQPDFAPFFNLAAEAENDEGQPAWAAPCQGSVLPGGSDGDRLREIDAVAPPLVPFLYPDSVHRSRLRSGAGRYAVGAKPPLIPRERWPEVVARAQGESLRSIARGFGVSHETVRAVLRGATG